MASSLLPHCFFIASSSPSSNMSSSSHSRSRSISSRRHSRCSDGSADFGVASHRDLSSGPSDRASPPPAAGLSPALIPRSPSVVRSVDGESLTSPSYAPTSPGGPGHANDTISRGHPCHEAPLASLDLDQDAQVADDGYGVLPVTSSRAISHPPSLGRIPWLHPSPLSPAAFATPSGLPSFGEVENFSRPVSDSPPRAPSAPAELDELVSRSLTGAAQAELGGRPLPEAIAAVAADRPPASLDAMNPLSEPAPRVAPAAPSAILTSALHGTSGASTAGTIDAPAAAGNRPLASDRAPPISSE